MDVVLEEFTLFTTWQVKACVLIFYNCLTFGLSQNLAVKIVGGYCALGFIIVQIFYLGVSCRPIYLYWTITDTASQCTSYIHHMITATVFYLSSDLVMLLIPILLLVKLHLPLKRKIVLAYIFSLGMFVILAAMLNRYYNFTESYSLVCLNWYIGKLFTAVYVSNIPLCWPLLRRLFSVKSFNDKIYGVNSNSYPPLGIRSPGSTHCIKEDLPTDSERLSKQYGKLVFSNESEEENNKGNLWPIKKDIIGMTTTKGMTDDLSPVEPG